MNLVRRVAAALALLVVVVGVPVALSLLGGNPLPDRWSWSLLLRPDDGGLLVGVVVVAGWIAWAVFTVSVAVEAVAVVSRHRVEIRLPGLGGAQRLAAVLVVAALAAPLARSDPAPPPVAAASVSAPAITTPASGESGGESSGPGAAAALEVALPAAAAPHGLVHVVAAGDDLWSLAERYYGSGTRWRTIAAANPDRLTGGPDALRVGWRLAIPEDPAAPASDRETVTVRRGDTLSSIADRMLGHASRWPELFAANRAILDDANVLAVGTVLEVPAAADHRTGARGGPRDTTADPPATPAGARSDPPGRQPDPGPVEHPPQPGESSPRPRVGSPEPTAPSQPASSAAPAPGSTEPETLASDHSVAPALLGSVGGLLAAGLVGALAARRRVQLQLRPVGRRIPHPPATSPPVEVELGARQRPLSLRSLDLALRAISAHCLNAGRPVPRLTSATVGPEQIELRFDAAYPSLPVGLRVEGDRWVLDPGDADYLKTVPGIGGALRPYPALLTVGTADDDRQVLVDIETLGLLTVDGPPEQTSGVLAAMAVELSFSPWADELIVTLVGTLDELPTALGTHNINTADDLDALIDRLESRARDQQVQRPDVPRGHERIDPDLADPWAPEVVLINAAVTDLQRRRLVALATRDPKPTLGVVLVDDRPGAPARLQFADDGSADLLPAGIRLTPQLLSPGATTAIIDLVAATGSDETTPAPWWKPPDPPPDNVTYLGRRSGGWGQAPPDQTTARDRNQPMTDQPSGDRSHPVLGLLGPVELTGAAGSVPTRAERQCLEYCGWLLERPGTTAVQMANALVVAEGTRRSNMSRLRTWLGVSAEGEPFLPDAYSGRIFLHPAVSSDWQRLQILVAGGVDRTSDMGLRAALELVRGAPLADAAPGQWHWAEELRTDMISAVRDIGVELTGRAIDEGDIDLARWAAARALAAAPGDELLLAARIRTEHLAGNHTETERLTLQVAAQARALGVDLDPATVALMQRVMEGRVRARLA